MKWLEGKKTYLFAIALFVLGGLQGLAKHYEFDIPDELWAFLYSAIGAGSLAALRGGVRKAQLALMLALCLPLTASAQTAVYHGRQYTPETFSRATWCNCPMCTNIRSQWAAQTMTVSLTSVPVHSPTPELIHSPVEGFTTETRTRVVTRYRTESYQERQCVVNAFGRKTCQIVTKTRQVPYQATETYTVRVPVARSIPPPKVVPKSDISDMPDATPQPVVDAMLAVMRLGKDDTLWDIGSGRDARFLVTACQRYGCKGVGIEINADHATASRAAINAKGLGDSITIITADALSQSYGAAKKVVMYQYDDLQEQIIRRLARGTLVGVYAHEPKSMITRRYRVGDEFFFVGEK